MLPTLSLILLSGAPPHCTASRNVIVRYVVDAILGKTLFPPLVEGRTVALLGHHTKDGAALLSLVHEEWLSGKSPNATLVVITESPEAATYLVSWRKESVAKKAWSWARQVKVAFTTWATLHYRREWESATSPPPPEQFFAANHLHTLGLAWQLDLVHTYSSHHVAALRRINVSAAWFPHWAYFHFGPAPSEAEDHHQLVTGGMALANLTRSTEHTLQKSVVIFISVGSGPSAHFRGLFHLPGLLTQLKARHPEAKFVMCGTFEGVSTAGYSQLDLEREAALARNLSQLVFVHGARFSCTKGCCSLRT